MDPNGCGDAPAQKLVENEKSVEKKIDENEFGTPEESSNEKPEDITPQSIEDHEKMLKDRIAHCRNVIENLKFELHEEKSKLKESKHQTSSYHHFECEPSLRDTVEVSTSEKYDMCFPTSMYSACVESKLARDDNLLEYEKQLEQYQNTLNMAQITKKQAIRKQMLAKAFRLKLMEVENQCNIELLRVKQSMQCLEPLHLIADKWKTDKEDIYDPSVFQLSMPQYPDSWSKVGETSAVATPRDDDKLEEDQNTAVKPAISE